MAYTSDVTQATAVQNTKNTDTAKTKAKSLAQEDFLKLLVAQLQHQDPLDPSDPTEFTAQLAQFSQLEQLYNLNETMASLANAENNSEKQYALGMIGKEVLISGSTFTLGNGPEEIGYNVDGNAETISIDIKDEYQNIVATLHPAEITPGNHFITWNGLDAKGEKAPPGQYTMVVNATSAGEGETVLVSPLVRAEVTGVELANSGAVLKTDAGDVKISDIKGIYEKNNSSATTTTETTTETTAAATSTSATASATTSAGAGTETAQEQSTTGGTTEEPTT